MLQGNFINNDPQMVPPGTKDWAKVRDSVLGAAAGSEPEACWRIAIQQGFSLRHLILQAVSRRLYRWSIHYDKGSPDHLHVAAVAIASHFLLLQARNTNIIEDLGRVSYVFSDKTGTLTSNEMRLRGVSIKGIPYGSTDFRWGQGIARVLPGYRQVRQGHPLSAAPTSGGAKLPGTTGRRLSPGSQLAKSFRRPQSSAWHVSHA